MSVLGRRYVLYIHKWSREPFSTEVRHAYREKWSIDLSFSERLVEQQIFVSCIRRYWLHTCTICIRSLNYKPLAFEINFHMVFSGFIDDVVKKESRQFLLNGFYAILWWEIIPHLPDLNRRRGSIHVYEWNSTQIMVIKYNCEYFFLRTWYCFSVWPCLFLVVSL